jgi:hypothetical protein
MKRLKSVIQRVSQLRQGDVVAVPLTHNQYAFGRVCREPTLAVFSKTSAELLPLEQIAKMEVLFYIGFIQTKVQTCDWIYLGKMPFTNAEDAWPPAVFIQDIHDPTEYRIYHRGEMRPAKEREWVGLKKFEMQPPFMIRERILEEMGLK